MSLLTYKVVVVGESGVGKTSMVQRLVDKIYTDDKQPTIGVEFKCFQTSLGEDTVKLNIWDTAGQEKFRSVSKAYFRNAVGAVLVYSISSKNSFDELDGWLNDLHSLAAPNAAIVLVGNKCDLEDQRQVGNADAELFAQRHGLEFLETSALDTTNIEETFVKLAGLIHDKVKRGDIKGNFKINSPQLIINQSSTTDSPQQNGGCC